MELDNFINAKLKTCRELINYCWKNEIFLPDFALERIVIPFKNQIRPK